MPNRLIRQIIQNHVPVTVVSSVSVATAAKLMHDAHVGALMVVEHGHLQGIFTERDALFRVLAAGKDPQTTSISEVMTADPQTISSDRPLGHALYMMHEGGYRHVPVVDHGRPLGMVSARDALGPEMRDFENQMDDLHHLSEVLG